MQHALREAARRGHRAVLLVGDAPLLRPLRLLGREDRRAVAAGPPTSSTGCWRCELVPGALDGARGLIGATGPLAAEARSCDAWCVPAAVRRSAATSLPRAA